MREKPMASTGIVAGVALLAGLLILGGCGGAGGAGPKSSAVNPASDPPSGRLEGGVRVVAVTARRFRFDPNRIVVRQGEKVRLELTSRDTTHGFNLERFGVKKTLEPGKTEKIDLTADKPGTFPFQCSVFCGLGHSGMRGELLVLAPAQ